MKHSLRGSCGPSCTREGTLCLVCGGASLSASGQRPAAVFSFVSVPTGCLLLLLLPPSGSHVCFAATPARSSLFSRCLCLPFVLSEDERRDRFLGAAVGQSITLAVRARVIRFFPRNIASFEPFIHYLARFHFLNLSTCSNGRVYFGSGGCVRSVSPARRTLSFV